MRAGSSSACASYGSLLVQSAARAEHVQDLMVRYKAKRNFIKLLRAAG
jgi:hypothetical protein